MDARGSYGEGLAFWFKLNLTLYLTELSFV